MPFLDFFRNIFGNRGGGVTNTPEPPQQRFDESQQYRDSFRNPIWQNDEEDEEDVSDFSNRQPRTRYQFRVFSDPFEMTRFFETQMDDIMRSFFGGFDGFGNLFGPNGRIFDFGNEALPMPENGQPNSLLPRDEVMKPKVPDTIDDYMSVLPIPDRNYNRTKLRDDVLKPSYEMPNPNGRKVDSDIDGKIESDELAKIWKVPSSNSVETFSSPYSFHSFGSSVSTQIVRRADGSVEERKTVRDSNGNEEVRITRQIGDKVHTIVSKKAKDGTEEKTEDIVNMDESELKGFDEKWEKIQITPKHNNENDFPWHKFFGPYPKL